MLFTFADKKGNVSVVRSASGRNYITIGVLCDPNLGSNT